MMRVNQVSKKVLESGKLTPIDTYQKEKPCKLNIYKANYYVPKTGSCIYKGEHLHIQVYALNYFIALNFIFTTEKPTEVVSFIEDVNEETAVFTYLSKSISISQKAKELYIQKDIKGFEENSFYIIKPNEYKCWHRAMAWYDLAEIKQAIESAEILHLNNDVNAS